ncbi:MAG TPA: metal ABC transporter permease [Candidatus Dormibacteraeota bacterium]|jgi:zinc/manganese transport system permease protein|nr:metal ABC transporter permease [Candidatus Dormibacteraeota bacterium]
MHALTGTVITGVPFSANPIDDLQQLLQFEFMRNAFVAGTAAAVAAGVVGYFVVLRSLSFAAHALTQIGFAGATGALAAGVNPIYGLLLINSAGAALIGGLGRRRRGRDVVVGVVQSAGLGLGLLFLALYRAHEAVPVLVGDAFGISATQVLITVLCSVAIVFAVALAFRPLLFASLDEEIAEARGVHIGLVSVLLLFVLAVTVSVDAPIIGVLLTFSLVVGPAATAALVSPRPGRAVALSVALSVLYIWVGLAVSYWVDFPPSVFVTGLAFSGYLAARAWRGGERRSGHA